MHGQPSLTTTAISQTDRSGAPEPSDVYHVDRFRALHTTMVSGPRQASISGLQGV
jgi:hypothetical protein